jgi:hypothetical protein
MYRSESGHRHAFGAFGADRRPEARPGVNEKESSMYIGIGALLIIIILLIILL